MGRDPVGVAIFGGGMRCLAQLSRFERKQQEQRGCATARCAKD